MSTTIQIQCLLLRGRLWMRWLLGRAGIDKLLIQALLIGLVGGLSSALFRWSELDIRWITEGNCDDLVDYARQLSPELRLLIPTAGGLVAGTLLWMSQRTLRSEVVIDFLEAIRLQKGRIPVRATLIRTLSSLTSISTGASIGREGGMVQLSATAASFLGRVFHASSMRLRLLVACGAAAGISSAYNTPFAAPLFIAEIVMGTLAIDILAPLMTASIASALMSREWLGVAPLFDVPEFARQVDIPFHHAALLGLCCGLIAPLFLITLAKIRKIFNRLPIALPFRLALGGLMVGLISLKVPEVWGNGHAVVDQILSGDVLLSTVIYVLVFKALATMAAFGSGTVGGIQTPTLTLGACVGWLYSQLVQGCAEQSTAYAALGMGALLSGTTLAPIMAIVMLFEMTMDTALFFPLIISAFLSRHVAAAIRPVSVYDKESKDSKKLTPFSLKVSDVAEPIRYTIQPEESLAEIVGRFWWRGTDRVWVTLDDGTYLGALSLREVALTVANGNTQLGVINLLLSAPPLNPGGVLVTVLPELKRKHPMRYPVIDELGCLMGEADVRDMTLAIHAV